MSIKMFDTKQHICATGLKNVLSCLEFTKL